MDTITLPTYDEFVNSKRVAADDFGFEVAASVTFTRRCLGGKR